MPNVLTEKAGPLPLWGWLGIATVGALLFASKGKGSSSNTAAQQAAAQQALTAQQAALAATAAANSPNSSANTGSSTYGSGGSSYSGNGHTGRGGSMTPVYSATPAASTTTPVAASSTASSTAPAAMTMSTAPAPVAAAAEPGPTAAWTDAPAGQSVQAGAPNSPYTSGAGSTAVPGGFMSGGVFYPAGPQGQTLTGSALAAAYQAAGINPP